MNKKINAEKKIKWQYYFARKFSLQRYQIVSNVFISDFYWRHFGIRLKNLLVKPEEYGNYSIWLESKEYQQLMSNLFKVVCKNLDNFYYYKKMIKKVQSKWIKAAKLVGTKAKNNLSNKKLSKLFDVYIHFNQEHFNKPIWIPFPLETLLPDAAQNALRAVLERNKSNTEYDKFFKIIFSPEEKNAITEAEEALLEITYKIKTKKIAKKDINKEIDKVAAKYCFIPCYDIIDNPWEKNHFQKEIEKLLKNSEEDLAKKLFEIKNRFKLHRKLFQEFLGKFKMKKRERELFIMAHELVFIKDERDDYRRLGSYLAQPLFQEIGRRLELTRREVAYLTIEETKRFLRESAPPNISNIKERVKGYLLMRKNGGKLLVATGQEMNKIIQQEFQTKGKDEVKEIRGIVGCGGKASGKVVIVKTKHDLRRIFEGSIMVAVTTSPDFVSAMKLAKAIVTDEGGITSHASIVARELKIPCLVGTKIATKIFKDGDLVEVDAINGIVKKI